VVQGSQTVSSALGKRPHPCQRTVHLKLTSFICQSLHIEHRLLADLRLLFPQLKQKKYTLLPSLLLDMMSLLEPLWSWLIPTQRTIVLEMRGKSSS
jgi:hypothetical protein